MVGLRSRLRFATLITVVLAGAFVDGGGRAGARRSTAATFFAALPPQSPLGAPVASNCNGNSAL